nr:hypothetical protein [Hymenobacter sp. BT188]
MQQQHPVGQRGHEQHGCQTGHWGERAVVVGAHRARRRHQARRRQQGEQRVDGRVVPLELGFHQGDDQQKQPGHGTQPPAECPQARPPRQPPAQPGAQEGGHQPGGKLGFGQHTRVPAPGSVVAFQGRTGWPADLVLPDAGQVPRGGEFAHGVPGHSRAQHQAQGGPGGPFAEPASVPGEERGQQQARAEEEAGDALGQDRQGKGPARGPGVAGAARDQVRQPAQGPQRGPEREQGIEVAAAGHVQAHVARAGKQDQGRQQARPPGAQPAAARPVHEEHRGQRGQGRGQAQGQLRGAQGLKAEGQEPGGQGWLTIPQVGLAPVGEHQPVVAAQQLEGIEAGAGLVPLLGGQEIQAPEQGRCCRGQHQQQRGHGSKKAGEGRQGAWQTGKGWEDRMGLRGA